MEDTDKDSEVPFIDSRYNYSSWERECLQEFESQPDIEARLVLEKEAIMDRLWASFQNAAKSVAELHRDRPVCRCCTTCTNHSRSWSPFQDAANRVTLLYKDGAEAFMLALEYGREIGYQKRNKDMLRWAKTRRKHLRRDDLVSFLCGRTSPRRRQSEAKASIPVSPKPPSDELYVESAPNDLSDNNHNHATAEGRKRNFSTDIVMESPSHKRQRFC
eukprot:gene9202-10176_t